MSEVCFIRGHETINNLICPLMSIAPTGVKLCVGGKCAMWVIHFDKKDPENESGHCGFIHPAHQGLVMDEETEDDDA